MSEPIEDYALLGNAETAALVSRSGSIDWLCLPRFDSDACFAALLGTGDHGRWLVAPARGGRATRRRYRGDTLVLDTDWETDEGAVTVTDGMARLAGRADVVRLVRGRRGRTPMRMELVLRPGYGSIVPWVRRLDDGTWLAVAGPDAVALRTAAPVRGEDLHSVAEFEVAAGESVAFVLTGFRSHLAPPPPIDAEEVLRETERWWNRWGAGSGYDGEWGEAVRRSLVTLKALTYEPTGGLVAAPTTSLPEELGGERNWDYRFCWLRDATFTLYALLLGGHRDEARAWREWLLRAAAGRPEDLQIMYGVAGERRLSERNVDWLPGYAGALPVRIGNAAHRQLQLDVYGEVMDVLHVARRSGLEPDGHVWSFQRVLLDFLESAWEEPDAGIWEVRGPRRHFTFSKVMSWVAFDRAVKAVERHGLDGSADRWRALRGRIHDEVCRRGFDPQRRSFVQAYGSRELDASLLLLPLVGFLPADDPRVRGTVEAIRRELEEDGLVRRYRSRPELEGVSGEDAAFLPCSFWLVDNLALQGRWDEARRLFEHLLSLRNDVGLLAEEYDPAAGRQLGNFPQALSHVALINSACNLSRRDGPMHHRSCR